jgi:tetratricopeptide (TPR) repeat protein
MILGRTRSSNWQVLVSDLILEGCFEDLAQIIPTWIVRIRSSDDWSKLLDLLEGIPKTQLVESAGLTLAYSQALAKNNLHDQLLDFTKQALNIVEDKQKAKILLVRSAGLHAKSDFFGTIYTLETALPFLIGEFRGQALGRLGLTLFQMGKPWEDKFLQASQYLSGYNLGLMYINYGYCLFSSYRDQEARAICTETLSILKNDSYSLAWLRYHLGSSYFRDFEILEAERHFIEAARLSINAKSFSMQSSILNGLASVYRAYGEWARAEFKYRRAIRIATDSFDRVAALTNLARSLLLAGHINEANETLEVELNPEDVNDPNIQVARALVFLHLNDLLRASRALESITTPIVGTYQWLERLCRAELARRHGQFTEAVQWLEGNPTHTLHMREEVRQWPELFALAKAAGLLIPEPLEYVQGSTVQVRARGVLHVAVNDRGVAIPPTGRVGELLVFLLEHEGEAPLDVILEAFYPNAVGSKERARARKMVWEHANTLRELLGWQDAVIALGGAYQLDPQTTWQYDIREARALRMFNGEFLAGVYSEWALEVGQQLARFAVDSDAGVHLN